VVEKKLRLEFAELERLLGDDLVLEKGSVLRREKWKSEGVPENCTNS